jgi:hypothetical protein
MVIRRIREHVAGHNWFAVAVDLAIVIIGVFIGIQASNWNAARIERGEVRAYKAQIIQNLKSNEREIAARGAYYRQARVHALATLRDLDGNPAGDEAFLIDAYQASQVWPVRMERSAYDEMIASGLAKSFGDSDIRQRLSQYYTLLPQFEATVTGTTSYRERIRREMKYAVQERLRGRCDDEGRRFADGFVLLTLPEKCRLDLSPALVTLATTRLRASVGLEQDLTRHIGDLDQKISLFDRRLQLARELRLGVDRLKE